jgi:hypothetical protein
MLNRAAVTTMGLAFVLASARRAAGYEEPHRQKELRRPVEASVESIAADTTKRRRRSAARGRQMVVAEVTLKRRGQGRKMLQTYEAAPARTRTTDDSPDPHSASKGAFDDTASSLNGWT